ncbi:uncharacterized protein LOC130896263 [Diorhabda carinulata]|uniref:uncharacterized protein LOC130896263 n=1 Tax=Diorhabda carinulata TaxID=1163345 RepID=UPI0025A1A39F|nr:uncharacterized protein LOC130896263 [Diorhabda carinulata]
MVKFGLILIVVVVNFCVATDYNVTEYVKSLPDDIKYIVEKALLLEKVETTMNCIQVDERTCPAMKFREPSGKCNNVRHPNWGARGQKLLRLIRPNYADGTSFPINHYPSYLLPDSRYVSSILRKNPKNKHESVTALLAAWSELLLHDLTSTGTLKNPHCCDKNKKHDECYNSYLNEEDCLEYMRTLPSIDIKHCKFEFRDQMNLATSFLDASSIYGNTLDDMNKIRLYEGGRINESNCTTCFSNPLYTVLMEEHNRIARELKNINTQWKDDDLFYESRRIVIAEIQHITYNEFLPLVLGEETMTEFDLGLKKYGRFSKYSSKNRTGIYNEAAVTALPILLSLLPQSLTKINSGSYSDKVIDLIRNPALIPNAQIYVTLRSNWDTFALLLHMSRDHGIAPYTKYLKLCNKPLKTIERFTDLEIFRIQKSNLVHLEQLYKNPNDIDLIVGAILEEPLPGSLLGPTFNCLLKKQFQLLRESDRFWYENDLPPSSFTNNQLKEIKKTTLSSILCANVPELYKLPPKVFIQEDIFLNSGISCDQYQLPQLTEWTNQENESDINEYVLKEALAEAQKDLVERRKMEYKVWNELGGVNPKSPQGTAVAFSKASKDALQLANSSLLFELTSNKIIDTLMHRRRKRQVFIDEELPILRNELTENLKNIDINIYLSDLHQQMKPNEDCDEKEICDSTSPFRTYTGYCNNLKHPHWGNSLSPFIRMLPSAYEDGISKAIVTGVSGLPLPNPRIVSRIIHPDISNIHSKYTLMTMQFAQLLDHDITLTPVHKGFEESIPDCRSCNSRFTVHPECDPLPIPPGDHYYPEFNVKTGERVCLHSMRSLPAQQHLGPREQMNMNSAFLDASMIYGENPCKARKLKSRLGIMNYTNHPIKGKPLLPQSSHHPECKSRSGLCFIAGDPRVSEQPALATIHTIFMREHNRISEILYKLNPHWDEDNIFEHVRRIVTAEFQHITYNEFLPRLLGWNAMNLYELTLLPNGYFKGYDPDCNPTAFNEFAAAAFRIGHSLLRPHIPRANANYEIVNPPILLRDGFFKMDMMLRENMVDEITRGLISTPIESMDQFITAEVTNHLFEDRKIPFSGIDLISRNLQRARDHGIPSYNNYRAYCNLKRATTFEDLHREMTQDSIAKLKSIYASVDDIDLFPGGMSEIAVKGGMVGPTFACIIGIQFRQLKKCDRFWYENDNFATRFTEQQLAEIRKISLAKILCDNMDVANYIQRYAFDLPSNFLNPRVPCHSLPSINIRAWKEYGAHRGCLIGDKYVAVGESNFPSPCSACTCTPQGGNCASLRIADCHKLIRFWSKREILKDEVCTAQCGYLLSKLDSSSAHEFRQHSINFLRNKPQFPPTNLDNSNDFDLIDFSYLLKK